jgi:hypothetical protein
MTAKEVLRTIAHVPPSICTRTGSQSLPRRLRHDHSKPVRVLVVNSRDRGVYEMLIDTRPESNSDDVQTLSSSIEPQRDEWPSRLLSCSLTHKMCFSVDCVAFDCLPEHLNSSR